MLIHPTGSKKAVGMVLFALLLLVGVAYLGYTNMRPVDLEKEAMREGLTAMQYYVTQEDGTEPAFQNEYWNNEEEGIYVDIVSGEALFSSTDKYDSGTGWPSFVKPIHESAVTLRTDYKLMFPRTEVRSTGADSHLGHLFDDGPIDRGGERYCMNSAALRFVPLADLEKEGYGEYLGLF